MSFEEEHTFCFSSSSNPSLFSPELTLCPVRKNFVDPPNEDIRYDPQRLHCGLGTSAETNRLCTVIFTYFFFTQVNDIY